MARTFGETSPYAAYNLYRYNSAFTILMPKIIHRALSLELEGASNWTWQQVLRRALSDFTDPRIPDECKDLYWQRFREEAKRAVCGVLGIEYPSQEVGESFLRALHAFAWLQTQEGYSDPCSDSYLNDYARSLLAGLG